MRPLSDPEWIQFQKDVDVLALNLPPWGGIVEWAGMDVLAFIGSDGSLFLTDVTRLEDSRLVNWKKNLQTEYDQTQEIWYWRLPESLKEVFLERLEQVAAPVNWGFENMGLLILAALGLVILLQVRRT